MGGKEVYLYSFMTNDTRRGWGVSVTPRSLFILGKDPIPIVQEAGWAPEPVWTGAENLAPTGIRSRTIQPVASHYTDYAARPSKRTSVVRPFSTKYDCYLNADSEIMLCRPTLYTSTRRSKYIINTLQTVFNTPDREKIRLFYAPNRKPNLHCLGYSKNPSPTFCNYKLLVLKTMPPANIGLRDLRFCKEVFLRTPFFWDMTLRLGDPLPFFLGKVTSPSSRV
jgi:hypothetical protein